MASRRESWLVPVLAAVAVVASNGAAPGLGVPVVADQEQVVAGVLAVLQHRDRWLVVLDNAPDADAVRRWVPLGDGHVLITSRDRDWAGLARRVGVEEFTRAESVAYLRRRTGESGPAVEELSRVLGDLPLALAQAASYLDRHALSVGGYLTLYRDREAAGQLLASGLPGYPRSVATTWLVHFDWLAADAPAALELLRLCAWCDPDDINLALLLSDLARLAGPLTGRLGDAAGRAAAREATIGALTGTGLVTRLDDDRIKVHRLVAQVTRHHLSAATGGQSSQAWALHSLALVVALMPYRPWDPTSWPVCADLVAHLLATVEHAPAVAQAGVALTLLGQYLRSRAEYTTARATLRRALAINEATYGPDHPEVAFTLTNLGIVERELGELTTARATLRRVLAIDEATYAPDNPEVAITLTNLGIVERRLGELTTARATQQRALAINEATYGPDHPQVARTLTNLGDVERQLGELTTARATLQRALGIFEAAYGPDHPDTAGKLKTGDKLPKTAELAVRYKVHAATAYRAVKELHNRDLVTGYPGRGVFVGTEVDLGIAT